MQNLKVGFTEVTPLEETPLPKYDGHTQTEGKNDQVRRFNEQEMRLNLRIPMEDMLRVLDSAGLAGWTPLEPAPGVAFLGLNWVLNEMKDVVLGDCKGQYGPYDRFYAITAASHPDTGDQESIILASLTTEEVSSDNAWTGWPIDDTSARIKFKYEQERKRNKDRQKITATVESSDGVLYAQGKWELPAEVVYTKLMLDFVADHRPTRYPTALASAPNFDVQNTAFWDSLRSLRYRMGFGRDDEKATVKVRHGEFCLSQIRNADGEAEHVTFVDQASFHIIDRARATWTGMEAQP